MTMIDCDLDYIANGRTVKIGEIRTGDGIRIPV